MTRFNRPTFLTPPREEEEIYPYRPVWSSIIIEVGGVFAVTIVFFGLSRFLDITFPTNLYRPISVLLAITPAILWLFFSRLRERFVPEPRHNLLSVFVVSALAANAVGLPLINALELDRWLSLSGAIDRVIGYTVSVGVIHEMLKYLVVRYMTFPDRLRIRDDAIAYCIASAIGYVTVLNLHAVIDNTIAPDIAATRIFSAVAFHIAGSIMIAYGLAELRFNPTTLFIMPLMLTFASIIHGMSITARSGFVNAAFVLGTGGTRPIIGLAISLVVVVGGLILSAFLFNAAERQEREAIVSREV